MPYLVNGGADAFRRDTDKIVKVAFKEFRVSGTNIKPIIEALQHYEATLGMGAGEQQKALCSILSRSNRWFQVKEAKVKVKNGARTSTPTMVKRSRVVSMLMQEALASLSAFSPGLNTAMANYLRNKNKPARATGTLAGGYANERAAYLAFDKSTSLSGSLIDDYLFKNGDRNLKKMPEAANKQFNANYRSKGMELHDLTLQDWKAINDIAAQLEGKQLEVRYMKRHERLQYMLESDLAGGLRYTVGTRSATSGNASWPWAMDEWGNVYTADEKVNKAGYAMFNHSTFTAGDDVVCAGMLSIDANGKLTYIDSGSGHYKPTREQLTAALTILRDEYAVDMANTEIRVTVPSDEPDRMKFALFGTGRLDYFLGGGAPTGYTYG